MTDENNKTEDEASADTAPYIKKNDVTGSDAKAEKQNSSTPWLILLIAAALVLLTIYKFNEERSATQGHADDQENIVETEVVVIETMPAIPVNDDTDMQAAAIAEQPMPPADESTPDQSTAKTLTEARTEAQERLSKNREMMLQRRQEYEQELQKKQQEFKSIIEAHQQERDSYIAKRKEEFERLKQERMEAREKIQEIQKQIYELHEKIRQIMMESHSQPES